MTERIQPVRPAAPPGVSLGAGDAGAFHFDRPAERGLAPRTYGEGTFPAPEAREAAADRLRDALMANYDPTEELTRMLDAGQTPRS